MSADANAISYRPFTEADLQAAHRLSVDVQWPHRIDDWRFVLRAGAGFVAEDETGVIGTALYWKFGEDRGSLGMVIVSPAHQGKGIGRRLMEQLLNALDKRLTFLHATSAGQPLYEKLGFAAVGGLHQHQSASFKPESILLEKEDTLRALTKADLPRLVELASQASGLDRSAVLPDLMAVADGVGVERDGQLVGFSLFRPFGRGFAIGPIVAPGSDQQYLAKALVTHWLAANEGAFVRLDTPADSGLSPWFESIGLPVVSSVVKMARDGRVHPSTDSISTDKTAVRQFGILNQAMG